MLETINILFLAAEATPFIKIGGLADVAGSLPIALRSLSTQQTGGFRLDVRLVLPLHRIAQSGVENLKPFLNFVVPTEEGEIKAQTYEASLNGVPTYFIDGPPISRSEYVYSPNPEDDQEKYTFFSLAVLELMRVLNWKVHIVHANDWHTALSIYALRTFKKDNFYTKTAGMITLHNLPYMGGDSIDQYKKYGVQELVDKGLPVWARNRALPLGLWASDAIVPVSVSYAREILTPEFGSGLQGFLQSHTNKIIGIINGLDVNQWDPATDKFLFSNFDKRTLETRKDNKISLIQKIGLEADPAIPLIGMVTRIDYQKGLDLVVQAIPMLTNMRWQLVILGSGDKALEKELNQFQMEYPDRVRVILGYDNSMSHLIYAGSDMFLMPSRYEPCGLSQMIAMRYGNIPVVHATGGLKDTVIEGKTGFVFEDSSSESQADAIKRALKYFSDPVKWQSLQRRGMDQDFSWTRSAIKYSTIYRSIAQKYLSGGD
ncbi:MAG: glycogen/starch synthase [Chloroflexota bacterium]